MASQADNGSRERRSRNAYILLILLAVAGLVLSIELFRIHLVAEKDPNHDFACRISETADCNEVARSPQAIFMGVPVPVWGMLTYVGFMALAIVGIKAKKIPLSHAGDYGLMAAIWCVIYSAYLAAVSTFVIETFCLYCAGLYIVNIGILFATLGAATPLKEFMNRRGEDFRWLTEEPVRLGIFGAGFLLLIIGVSGLFIWSSRNEKIKLSGVEVEIDTSKDPMTGYYRAPITIIEFSDFECPACRKMHIVIKQVMENYQGQIRLIHKNYPLDSKCNSSMTWHMHPRSCDAAAAAECALLSGKFEAYTERLWYSENLDMDSLVEIANQEGMDPAAFRECINGDDAKRAVLIDVEDGNKIGIQATPTFIVNDHKFSGVKDVKWCSRLIEKFLNNEPIPPSGLPLDE